MEELVGRAPVVDFVEVHAVAEGEGIRVQFPLVEQGGIVRRVLRHQDVPRRIPKHQLYEGGLAVCQSKAKLRGGGFEGRLLPGEDLVHGQFPQIGPALVRFQLSLHHESPAVPGRYVIGKRGGRTGAEGKLYGLALYHVQAGDGSLTLPQVIEGEAAVQRRDGQHAEDICLVQGKSPAGTLRGSAPEAWGHSAVMPVSRAVEQGSA